MLFASTERFDEARTYEYRALASNLDYPQVRYSLALLDLTQGNWLTGFAGYEYRWVGSDRAGTQTMPSVAIASAFQAQRWEALATKTLEQAKRLPSQATA
jgi:hypothetical protein